MEQRNKMQAYTDKYFLRSNQILKGEGLNPWVNMQVFVRNGPGKIAGMKEAIDLIVQNSNLESVGGRIYAKNDGGVYQPKETIMNLVAPIQEIMELETLYLGVIATAVTRENDKHDLDFNAMGEQMRRVVDLAGDRPVLHFGARHWHWTYEEAIANLAFANGVREVATDHGAAPRGKWGVGTIPHALENVFAYYFGRERAVVESTLAFDRHIPSNIPRVALIDYNNREITDTLATAEALGGRLAAVRVDTCGENLAEGGVVGNRKYWEGKGVTIEGIRALRKAMDAHPIARKAGIYLSSGFSNPEKVAAFNEGESLYGVRLYEGIGAGFLDGVRCATADIIAMGETPEQVDFYNGHVQQANIIHKVGRPPRLNPGLDLVIGGAR